MDVSVCLIVIMPTHVNTTREGRISANFIYKNFFFFDKMSPLITHHQQVNDRFSLLQKIFSRSRRGKKYLLVAVGGADGTPAIGYKL